jgi:hypothetical protein
MARQNAARRKEQLAAAEAFLAGFGQDRLAPGTELDLLGDLARPLFRAIKKATLPQYADYDDLFDLIEQIPLLLAPATPLKRRMAINDRIVAFREMLGDQVTRNITMLVLGQGPLTGSLTMSLYALIGDNPDKPLSAIRWPAKLPESVLTYVDRICTAPVTIGGDSFETGEYIRCMIRVPGWGEDEIETVKFGIGSHLCIGRSLSETVWGLVVAMLSQSELVATAGRLEMRAGKEPFYMPSVAEISLRARRAA